MSSKGTVLVTGGTGFLGSHVISQCLEHGYVVRGTARAASKLQAGFPNVEPEKLQIVEVPTLTSDHSEVLKGVDAIIHVASPVYALYGGQELFSGAYEGTLNIVRQAIAAGVKKIIVTGTMVAMFDADFKAIYDTRTITEKDFGSVTLETIDINKEPIQVYQEAKTLADKALWDIARQNPDVDITVILPPALFGPQITPLTSHTGSLATNDFIRQLMVGSPEYPDNPIGHFADVRDVARAHINALSAPPISGRDKRFIVTNSTYKWPEITALVRKERPELAHLLPREDAVSCRQTSAPLDTTFARDVLGITSYIPREETLLAAVDVCAEWLKLYGGSKSA